MVNLTSDNARVYLDYDPANLPQKPSQSEWTRFICISDTHSRTSYKVPDGDVLIHAGDMSSWGKVKQLQVTMDWLYTLSHPHKLIVAGNHDLCLDPGWTKGFFAAFSKEQHQHARSLLLGASAKECGISYLEHQSTMVTVSDRTPWLVYGSPSAPIYSEGAFQYHRGTDADAIYQLIPPETEVLITHTPPRDVLDRTRRGIHAGCEQLAAHLPRLANLRLLVFGHIHEGHGAVFLEIGDPPRVVVAVNAAVAREGQPVVVDLKNVC